MEVLKTTLGNVLKFIPDIFEDFRGQYVETYNEKLYTEAIKRMTGHEVKFIADDISTSPKNVLRGIHGDSKTWKLIDCLHGRIYVVIVNCDEESKNFTKWEAFTLTDRNRQQVLVPPKFGTSHLVLSNKAIFHYKQSTYYDPGVLRQFTYRYNDSKFNIRWPIENPILSERDKCV